jgi:hypothetical protein
MQEYINSIEVELMTGEEEMLTEEELEALMALQDEANDTCY